MEVFTTAEKNFERTSKKKDTQRELCSVLKNHLKRANLALIL